MMNLFRFPIGLPSHEIRGYYLVPTMSGLGTLPWIAHGNLDPTAVSGTIDAMRPLTPIPAPKRELPGRRKARRRAARGY